MRTLVPGVLTVGAYASFAPVVWAENGTAQGKDIRFLRAFARQSGLAVDVRFFEFDRIWERPLRKQVDIAAGGIAPFDRRQTSGLAWSTPYHTVQRSLVIRKEDAAELQTMADFGGRTIAVTRGSTADLDAQRRKPETARIVYFHRQEEAVEDLIRKRIDAFGTGDICGIHVAAQHASRLAVSDVHETETPEHFAFAMEGANATRRFPRLANGLITRSKPERPPAPTARLQSIPGHAPGQPSPPHRQGRVPHQPGSTPQDFITRREVARPSPVILSGSRRAEQNDWSGATSLLPRKPEGCSRRRTPNSLRKKWDNLHNRFGSIRPPGLAMPKASQPGSRWSSLALRGRHHRTHPQRNGPIPEGSKPVPYAGTSATSLHATCHSKYFSSKLTPDFSSKIRNSSKYPRFR